MSLDQIPAAAAQETRAGAAEAAAAAPVPVPAPVLVVAAPAPGTTVHLAAEAHATYRLDFAPEGVTVSAENGALVLAFPPQGAESLDGGEGARLVIGQVAELAETGAAPVLEIAGRAVSSAELLGQALALSGETAEPLESAAEAVAAGGGAHGYSDDLGQVLELLSAQGVIDPTELSFRLIALEDRTDLPREGVAPEGALVINEIGLGVETSVTVNLVDGEVILDGVMNYVELFNDTGLAFTTGGHGLEFLNPGGAVVALALPDGLEVPPGGFLAVYQFADQPGPTANVFGQVFDAAGVLIDAFFLPAEAYWDLGADCSEPLAVNLVQGAESLDTFAANLETADLAGLTDPQWQPGPEAPAEFALLFETFNGASSPAATVFSRVFTGGAGSGAGLDSDTAADWTTSLSETVGALNDVPGFPAPGPEDANPGDPWHDDLDPQQGNGEALAGQTVIVGGAGADLIEGFGGPDFLFGGAGNDSLYGGSQADLAAEAAILGEAPAGPPEAGFSDHNDFLAGGLGDDALYGGAGLDLLSGGLGNDSADGGTGDDTIVGDDAVDLGDGGDDVLAGDGLNNLIDQPEGVLALTNRGGDDVVLGGSGNDRIGGESVAYSLQGAAQSMARNDGIAGALDPDGNDSLAGGDGDDLVAGTALAWSQGGAAFAAVLNTSVADGPVDADSLDGGAGDDGLAGEALAVSLTDDARVSVRLEAAAGSVGDDTIAAGAGADMIAGEALALAAGAVEAGVEAAAAGAGTSAGNDQVSAGGGHDLVAGELLAISETGGTVTAAVGNAAEDAVAGCDTLTGGGGSDVMAGDGLAIGGDASTLLVVNEGDGNAAAGCDLMVGGAGGDVMAGDGLLAVGAGTVTVENRYLLGLPSVGRDTLQGGSGADVIAGDALAVSGGTAFVDHLGAFLAPPAGDEIDGGSGDDTISGDALAVDGTASVGLGGSDTISGGDGDDVIAGDALVMGVGTTLVNAGGDDYLDGGAGNDLIYGDANLMGAEITGGNDTLMGGAGNDTLFGNGGDDTLGGGADDDTLIGGSGDDLLAGEEGNDVLDGEMGSDTLLGGLGNDFLMGGLDDDFLFGGGDADTLFGGSGNDTLNGGAGDDVLSGGMNADTFAFSHGNFGETDSVTDFAMGEGDLLDFGDLLLGVGADDGVTLDDYLQVTWDGVNSTIGVDLNGDASGFTDHYVVIEGQDLTSLGATQDQILQALIDGGHLTGL
ncbi:MAG: hypothetical protein Kow00114_25600 [Kiloniellaceae bacterium]